MNKLYLLAIVTALAVFGAYKPVANAAPTFYLTTHADGSGGGDLDLFGNAGKTGTFYLAVNSDTRLSSVSLDLLSSNPGFFKFTGVSVKTDDGRWAFLDGPTTIAANGSSITNIGGAAIPFVSGSGIGAGSGIPNPAVIASINYMFVSSSSTSNLILLVGSNYIADWDTNEINVQFGGSSALIMDAPGNGAFVGEALPLPEPPTCLLFVFSVCTTSLVRCRRRPTSHNRV